MLILKELHSWNLNPRHAVEIQAALCARICLKPLPVHPALVAGVDVSGVDGEGYIHAAVVVIEVPSMKVRQVARAARKPSWPYVPGLLSFREIPVLAEALKEVIEQPDLLIVDGQGVAHPRRFGLASHLGLLLGMPTIGCAKSKLTGEYKEPGDNAGEWSPLIDKNEIIGAALRTKKNVRPVFVSPGNLVDLTSAREWVLKCVKGYRLPEPTRLAHLSAAFK